MNLYQKILYWLGLIDKEFHHIVGPAKTIVTDLETLAARKREDVIKSANAIKEHEGVIGVAGKAAHEAETIAAKFRSLLTA